MRGKLFLIEGTDCSGKATQSDLLVKRLKENGQDVELLSFPMYDTPTGKIIGGPFLGKPSICASWFSEGAPNVDPRVSSLYYTADRLYNLSKITNLLDLGINVILDRYTPSNMAHHGSKINDPDERLAFYKWIDELEYDSLKLPRPDKTYLLYMPHEYAEKLRASREETLDDNEKASEYLKKTAETYLEISKIYDFKVINCVTNDRIKTIEEINNELYNDVLLAIVKQ
jgi:dTMP kinase